MVGLGNHLAAAIGGTHAESDVRAPSDAARCEENTACDVEATHGSTTTTDVAVLLPVIRVAVANMPPENLPAFALRLAALQMDVASRMVSAPSREPTAATDSGVADWSVHARRVTGDISDAAPPAPTLASLPLITKGPRKGERWMNKREFAGWCGVAVATVSDWIYTQRIEVVKRGNKRQSRVQIPSGERERLRPPVVNRSRKGEEA